MARTYHHDRKGFHPWEARKVRKDYWRYVNYSTPGPGWWRRMMMEKPMRRQVHMLERTWGDGSIWPHPRRPTLYYY